MATPGGLQLRQQPRCHQGHGVPSRCGLLVATSVNDPLAIPQLLCGICYLAKSTALRSCCCASHRPQGDKRPGRLGKTLVKIGGKKANKPKNFPGRIFAQLFEYEMRINFPARISFVCSTQAPIFRPIHHLRSLLHIWTVPYEHK